MLFQVRAPRLRPVGGPVLRVRRPHPLAAELRALVLFGGDAGVGIDLVSGQPLTASGTPEPMIGGDGPALATASGYGILSHDAALNITGTLTIALRLRSLTTNPGLVSKDGGGFGATNTPYFLAGTSSALYFVRSNSLYRAFQSTVAGLVSTRVQTFGVCSADVLSTPTFHIDGASVGATGSFTNGGSGAATGNTNPVHFGNGNGGELAIAAIAARLWSVEEHADFDADPYALVEDAPRYHFLAGTRITYALTPTNLVTGAPVLGAPSLAQIHALSSTSLSTGAPVLGSPTLNRDPIVPDLAPRSTRGIRAPAPALGLAPRSPRQP